MAEARPVRPEDLPAMGRSLGRAFSDDPVLTHLSPKSPAWVDRATGFFTAAARHRMRQGPGCVWTVDGVHGGAVWAPPGQWKETPAAMARAMPAALNLFRGRILVALGFLSTMEKAHPRAPEHWYLAILGTDPDHQGTGVGSALLAPVLERCDAEGTPAYLESSKLSNVAFYARHGFEERETLVIDGGPTMYPMWREPRG